MDDPKPFTVRRRGEGMQQPHLHGLIVHPHYPIQRLPLGSMPQYRPFRPLRRLPNATGLLVQPAIESM